LWVADFGFEHMKALIGIDVIPTLTPEIYEAERKAIFNGL